MARLALLGLLATSARGEGPLPPPGSAGWESLEFPSVQRATEYREQSEDGSAVLHATSDCAASALVLSLESVDLSHTPRLRWRWRVSRSPEVGDERSRAGDDFAARVYVMFPPDPESVGVLDRLRRKVAERWLGRPIPGRAINYVWSSREPAGAGWDNPYAPESRMVSLGRGPLQEWTEVEVDLQQDHRAIFGSDAPPPLALAVMTDADDSCSRAEAWFADLEFRGPEEGAPDVSPPAEIQEPPVP
ncbi:MAG: DUF3047 domain-containing protein [Myxococcota bacterium]